MSGRQIVKSKTADELEAQFSDHKIRSFLQHIIARFLARHARAFLPLPVLGSAPLYLT